MTSARTELYAMTEERLSTTVFLPLLFSGVVLAACYGSTFMLTSQFGAHNIDKALAGETISAGVVTTLIFSVLAGRVAERIGLFGSLAFSGILMSASMLCYAAIGTVSNIGYLGGLAMGVAWSVFYILAPLSIINLVKPSRRVKYLTYFSGAQMLGLGMMKPLGDFLSGQGISYTSTFVGLGVLALLTVIPLSALQRSQKHIDSPSYRLTFKDTASVLSHTTFLPVLIIAISACTFAALGTFQSIYAAGHGVAAHDFFLVFTFVTVSLRFGLASTLQKLPIYTVAISLTLAIGLAILGLYVLDGSSVAYWIASATYAVGYGLIYSTLNSIVVNVAEEKGLSVGASSQVFTVSYFIGLFGFPVVASQIIRWQSFDSILLVLTGAMIVATSLAIKLRSSAQ